MDDQTAAYREARRAVERSQVVRVFLFHLVAYIVGNVFLGFWNALTYFVKDSDTLWFYIPLLFWGVGVLIHYVQGVALFDEWWELDERTIETRRQG